MPQAMSGCKSSSDEEWKKLETIPVWQLKKVQSRKEVVQEAQKDKKKESTLLH